MAMIRRHWKTALVHLLVLVLAVAGFTYRFTSKSASLRAAEAVSQTPTPLDPQTWTRISQLRQQLCLTNADLAAMGCSEEQAAQVMTQLLGWYEQNKSGWEQMQAQEIRSDRELQDTFRKINVGPKDEAVLAQLLTLQATQGVVQAQRQRLEQSAAGLGQALFTSAQSEMWSIARTNASAPGRWRYAPGLSAEQIKSLTLASYKQSQGGSDSSLLKSVESSVLSPTQKSTIVAAQQNQQQYMSGVIKAEQQTLPLPIQLRVADLATSVPVPLHQ